MRKSLAAESNSFFQAMGVPSCGARLKPLHSQVFAFARTLSRLNEMSSVAYLVRSARGGHTLSSNAVPLSVYSTGALLSVKEARQLFSSYDVDASGKSIHDIECCIHSMRNTLPASHERGLGMPTLLSTSQQVS